MRYLIKKIALQAATILLLQLQLAATAQSAPALPAQSPPTLAERGSVATSTDAGQPNVQAAKANFAPTAAADVLDIARLTIETVRDQHAGTAQSIERATNLILAFFTVLGLVAAAFGWSRLRDIKAAGDTFLAECQRDLEMAKSEVSKLRGEFEHSLEKVASEMRLELFGQAELMAARVELDQALNHKDQATSNRMLLNAVRRINAVLDAQPLSASAHVRGLADLAYALKRLGDVERAYETICKAAELAESEVPASYSLVAYNVACYGAIAGRHDALIWLEKAIGLDPQYKLSAAKDSDFESVRESEHFKALVA